MFKLGIIDTAYSRVDMMRLVLEKTQEIARIHKINVKTLSRTVPGHKELAVEALRLIEDQGCDICIVLGWVGPRKSDLVSAHEACMALNIAKTMSRTHILECIIYESDIEEKSLLESSRLKAISCTRHALGMISDIDCLKIKGGEGDREGAEPAIVFNIS